MGNRHSVQNEEELNAISTILTFSLNLGWISEGEKSKVESKTTVSDKKLLLYEILESMEDFENATRLLRAIRFVNDIKLDYSYCASELKLKEYFELICKEEKVQLESRFNVESTNENSEPISSNNNLLSIETNAILLSPVIRCLFKYLDLSDLQNCRYVCQEWNSVAQPILRTRSKIAFPKYDWDDNIFLLSEFYQTFSKTLESMPFTSFELNHISDCPFNLSDLEKFFQKEKKTLRELRINFLHVTNGEGGILSSFDVTPWLLKSSIAEETKHHTKFDVFGSLILTQVIVQASALVNVKELILYNCQINLEDKIKCQPTILKINCVAIFKNGNKLPEVCVNDFVDFSRIKHLELRYFDDIEAVNITKLSLDLKGNLELESLSLSQITVFNWRTCTWIVKKLELSWIQFVEDTRMKIKELDFLINKIDLCCLPQSIEKLTIDKFTVEDCFCSRSAVLPNLKSLSLNFYNNCFSVISDFVQCQNLVNLHLESSFDDLLGINSDWMPKSLKRLKLDRVAIHWGEEENNFNLDKLVLIDNSFLEVKNICSAIDRVKDLVVRFPHGVWPSQDIFNFFFVRNCRDYWQRIVVGPIHWENVPFENSSLVQFVDKKAEYYILENQTVKAFDSFFTFREYEDIQNSI